jgi:3-hydroxybutyryl-CoA dehydratase
MLKIGQTATSTRKYTSENVSLFANLTGDRNPIHLNEEFAKQTIFKNPIVHGILVVGQISELLANHLPGPGTIYLEQKTRFMKPVFHDSKITCEVSIEDIEFEKCKVKLKTICKNQNNEIVIEGYAIVKVPKELLIE